MAMNRTPHLTPLRGWQWRLAVVAAAALVAFVAGLTVPRAGEAAFVMPALCLAGVSVLLAWRIVIFAANSVAGLALFIPAKNKKPHWVVLETNRQLGHFEALLSWLTLALVWAPNLIVEVTLVAALFALGPMIISAAGVYLSPRRPCSLSELHLVRRKYFYIATALGLLLLSLFDTDQAATLFPLDVAILSGVVIRAIYFAIRTKVDDAPVVEEKWLYLDRAFVVLALGGALALPYLEYQTGERAGVLDAKTRNAGQGHLSCDARAVGFEPEASLFLVSDNQFHVLDGKRNGLQLPLIDAVVPVAARPVELDLLSQLTLNHLADLFRALSATRPGMLWAHLGDIGDVGCQAELQRFDSVLHRFGTSSLAALAPGNHDSTFLGNFAWHPEWRASCSKTRTNPGFNHDFLFARAPGNGQTSPPELGFLARVAKLGTLRGGDEIQGVFLDSSDYGVISLGIAGSQGAISEAQADWVVKNVPAGNGPVVIFMHHTYEEFSLVGKAQLTRLTNKLGNRLLAIVSAHTHLAANRRPKIGERLIDEVVVGSTIDPPQEATLIDFRTGPNGPQMHAQSIPAIPAAALTCPEQKELSGLLPALEDCLKELKPAPPACQPLLDPIITNPQSPEELSAVQNQRAKKVLVCLGMSAADRPLDDPEVFNKVSAAQNQTLALCLSSAASLVQGHKAEKWSLVNAIDAMQARSPLMGNRSIVVPSVQ